MGGGGNQKSVQSTEPPSYVRPYITGGPSTVGVLPEAQRLYQSPMPSYYPGNTVAGFSPAQLQAQQGIANRAVAGSPLNAAASSNLLNTLNGAYLGQDNPYLGAIRQRGQLAASQIAGQFAG